MLQWLQPPAPPSCYDETEYQEEILSPPVRDMMQGLPEEGAGFRVVPVLLEDNSRLRPVKLQLWNKKCVFSSIQSSIPDSTIPFVAIRSVSKFSSNGVCVTTPLEQIRFRIFFGRDTVFSLLRTAWASNIPRTEYHVLAAESVMMMEPALFGSFCWRRTWWMLTSKVLAQYRVKGEKFPELVIPLDTVYEIDSRTNEGIKPAIHDAKFGFVIQTLEQSVVISFERESDCNRWRETLRFLIEQSRTLTVVQACFGATHVSLHSKTLFQFDFKSYVILKRCGTVETRHSFKHLLNVVISEQNVLTLTWADTRQSDEIVLASDKERSAWQCLFEAIVMHRNSFKLSNQLQALLRPAKVGIAKMYVKYVWVRRWIEMTMYGELVIFQDTPCTPMDVNNPIDVYKIVGSQVFRKGDTDLHVFFSNSNFTLELRFNHLDQRESWWEAMTSASAQKLRILENITSTLRQLHLSRIPKPTQPQQQSSESQQQSQQQESQQLEHSNSSLSARQRAPPPPPAPSDSLIDRQNILLCDSPPSSTGSPVFRRYSLANAYNIQLDTDPDPTTSPENVITTHIDFVDLGAEYGAIDDEFSVGRAKTKRGPSTCVLVTDGDGHIVPLDVAVPEREDDFVIISAMKNDSEKYLRMTSDPNQDSG